MRNICIKDNYTYSYIIKYVPKAVDTNNPLYIMGREDVYAFQNGHVSTSFRETLLREIQEIVKDEKSDWCVCVIPAATEARTARRYGLLSELIESSTGVKVYIDAITLYDREPMHFTADRKNLVNIFTYNLHYYYGKKVILIDDMINTGNTFKHVADRLMETGAKDVRGLFFSKVIHPNIKIPGSCGSDSDKTSQEEQYVILTQELLDNLKTRNGGYKARQLALLDVEWPPYKGWKKDMIGKKIPLSVYKKIEKLK